MSKTDPSSRTTAEGFRHESYASEVARRHPVTLAAPDASSDDTASPSIFSHQTVHSASPLPAQFQAATIAPSPPRQSESLGGPASSEGAAGAGAAPHIPSSALHVSTDFAASSSPTPPRRDTAISGLFSPQSSRLSRKGSATNLYPVSRTPSLKATLGHSFGSVSGTSSAVPSPIITAMGDVTPLPSPLLSGDSPGPWKMLGSSSPPEQRGKLSAMGNGSVLVTSAGEAIDTAMTNASKRKVYASLEAGQHPPAQAPSDEQSSQRHARNRSVSDYVPDASVVPKRQVTVSGSRTQIDSPEEPEPQMRREANLAQSRGLTPAIVKPPTPPPSESSKDSVDGAARSKTSGVEYFEARGRHDQKRRRWRSIRSLGQGTFSRVILATSQGGSNGDAPGLEGATASADSQSHLDRKALVAIKVCEHGPRGGASEERVEMSLKRELEIMQTIHHPSLVDLKAWSIEPTRAILVLSYCPGGDLFDVATAHRAVLTPALLRRTFAELVGAVEYLHEMRIVHRDIKLENVLVNLTPDELARESVDWATYPYAVITLTDLGLSRRIADDEKLETRCGSDDYAAPEVIMGQPYDGRATDAWSLGVLLYALLEARLPFDPHPGMTDAHRMRSRTSHRIARVEWRWVEYAGDEGDHEGDEAKFEEKGLLGAMEITEGLLKRARSRWSVDKVASQPWVRDAIRVEDGLKFTEVDDGEEIS